MKKIIVMLLCVCMVGAMVSCNKDPFNNFENITIQQATEHQSNCTESDGQEFEITTPANSSESTEVIALSLENAQPVYSSYVADSAYLQKQNDLFITKANNQRYFYIPKWKNHFLVEDDFTDESSAICGFVGKEIAWIFEYDHGQTRNTNGTSSIFNMLKIHRQTKVQEKSSISLPVSVYGRFSSMFCNMLDDNNGFLFVYASDNSQIYLASLAKTTDGGNSWTLLKCDETWSSEGKKDKIIVSHFFDENNGMIIPRTSAGANANALYITLNGGKTWNRARIPFNDYDSELIGADNRYLELANFDRCKGEYILTFRLRVGWGDGTDGELIRFVSINLITWVYLP